MLDREICERISKSVSVIIGRHVLITDRSAIVIGSDDPERIGTLHEASLEVLKTGRQIYHTREDARRLEGTKPGITIPLTVKQTVMGTIGITGSPEDVSKYVMLISVIVQSFMDFNLRQQTSAYTAMKKWELFQRVTRQIEAENLDDIRSAAFDLGYDLDHPRICIIFQYSPYEKDNGEQKRIFSRIKNYLGERYGDQGQFLVSDRDQQTVVFALYDNALIRRLDQQADDFMRTFVQHCEHLYVGVGAVSDHITKLRASYLDAKLAIKVLKSRGFRHGKLYVKDIRFEKAAVSLPETAFEEDLYHNAEKLLTDKEESLVFSLIDSWCRSRFNFTKTAQLLHIHKSTLVYRFQRITEKYGLDLYDFDTAMTLYLLLLRERLL